MRVCWLQHADYEDSGCIEAWLLAQGHVSRGIAVYAAEALPSIEDFDALIVLGGPMNIYQHAEHPWLLPEKALIRAAIGSGKRVLGICLGAQLIADALGGPVTRNAELEIGWFPVSLTAEGRLERAFADLPPQFTAFHWHGDTYALPHSARLLAHSEACGQQAFSFDGGRVLGLQFHLEATQAGVSEWLANGAPKPRAYVQPAESILAEAGRFEAGNRLMLQVLTAWLA